MFMAGWCKEHLSDEYEIVNVMANTGEEHADTLRFADAGDRHFGLNLVWVEAVVHPGRTACTHRVVSYETASRKGEPFEAVVAKYGLPNQTYKHCTRELKLNPINSYAESIGWEKGSYTTAIGLRTDELRRVSKNADTGNLIYPLIDMFPTDKEDVLTYFEAFPWDLRIEEFDGNCKTCFKKSDAKLLAVYRNTPESFDFPIRLDALYKDVGGNNIPGPRRMFRGFRSAPQLVAQFQRSDFNPYRMFTDGGCSESCELFPMDEFPEVNSYSKVLDSDSKKPNGLQSEDCNPLISLENLAEWTGLEPATPGVTGPGLES